MKSMSTAISRSLMTLAVVGLGLALTPRTASAALITFTVDESAVPGATSQSFSVDGMTAKYVEALTLDGITGTFTGHIVVNFTAYTLTNNPTPDQIGAVDPGEASGANLYSMYALVTASGTFAPIALSGGRTLFDFLPTASTADLYLDPLRDTTKSTAGPSATGGAADDLHILTAGTLNTSLSNGEVFTRAGVILSGSFALIYTDPAVVSPTGPLYWPTLSSFILTSAVASGDVDPTEECTPNCSFPDAVVGDVSISFQGKPIPEPATLTLLGLGLVGSGFAARRRKAGARS